MIHINSFIQHFWRHVTLRSDTIVGGNVDGICGRVMTYCKTCENKRFIIIMKNFIKSTVKINLTKLQRLVYHKLFIKYLSHCIRKPTKCLGENKGIDQLRGKHEADQRLCFRYMDSAISLLLKYKISSL